MSFHKLFQMFCSAGSIWALLTLVWFVLCSASIDFTESLKIAFMLSSVLMIFLLNFFLDRGPFLVYHCLKDPGFNRRQLHIESEKFFS